MDYTHSIDIDAPPDVVWQIMSDVERWPEWTASVTKVTRADAGPLAVGSRATLWQPKFPRAQWTVTRLLRDRGFSWDNRAPGIHVTGHHDIEPRGKGSRVSLRLHYEGLLGRLLARLTRGITLRYLAMEAEGLKRRAESAAGG